MNDSRFSAGFLCLVTLIGLTPAAFGDAVCNAGFRDATAAERAQMTNVLKAAQSALPPTPEGWIIAEDTSHELSVPTRICRDGESRPWSYGLSRTFRQTANAEARQETITDQAARQKAAMQERQPRLNALQAKLQTINQQQVALIQKGDYAGAEKLQPQAAATEKEYNKLLNEVYDPSAMATAAKEHDKDLEMSIRVSVNPGIENAGPGATALTLPASGKFAQRWHVEDESQSTDQALYLFGTWRQRSAGSWNSMAREGLAPTGAHAIAVHVSGDPARVTKTLPTIAFAKVAALVR